MFKQKGWFRPSETCLMRDEMQPFCPVCREKVLLHLCEKTHPFQVAVQRVDDDHVRLVIVSHAASPLRIVWERNGGFDRAQGDTYLVSRDELPWGESELEVEMTETSDWIRDDPLGWSTWTVRFVLDKGYAWDHGVKVKGPWAYPPRPAADEDLVKLFDRG
jgi:hypothetical protein